MNLPINPSPSIDPNPAEGQGQPVDPASTKSRLCTPLAHDGTVNHCWCKSNRVAIADVADGQITDWREIRWAGGLEGFLPRIAQLRRTAPEKKIPVEATTP